MTLTAPTVETAQLQMQHHSQGVLLRTIVIGLTAFLTVVDLFATQAILPSLTRAYGVTPAAMGFAVNASTMGMAVVGIGRIVAQPAYQPAAGYSDQPRRSLGSHGALGNRPESDRVHAAAHCAGALHGVGVYPHSRLPGRRMQRERRRWRFRGLHNRQRCKQPHRPPDLGRRRRPSRPGF